ncbi:MAG: flagellar hook-length control protein FliK, partial [Armatimonadota bacterium]
TELELLASIAWSITTQTAGSQPKPLPNADPPPSEPVERDFQTQPTPHAPRTDGAFAELASNSALESARPAGKIPPKEASAQQMDEPAVQTAPPFELDVRPSTAAEKPETTLVEYPQKLMNNAPQTAEDENSVPTPPAHITHQAQNSVQAPHHSGPPVPAQAYMPQPPRETLQIHSAFWLERNADGSGSLLIELRPPALGPIEVLVSAKGTSVSADLIAPDQNAFELLQNHLGALQEALLATGLSVDTLQVNVAARDEHKHSEDRFRKTNRVRYINEPTTTPVLDSTFRTGLRYFSTLDLVA